jgi:aspartate/methionine/tyrosine aminotransferase
MSKYMAERIAGFGTTVFSEMSRLAVEHNAINLGQGFPEFPGPQIVKDAAKQAIDADLNQYAPSHGMPRLRNAIADTFQRTYGMNVDSETEVTVTTGATEALQATMLAFLNPGDEVIVFEPFYDAYPPQVIFAGGVLKPVRMHTPDWIFDPDELARAFSPRTRMILINTPHNPTGKVFTEEELDLIAELCQLHDVLAVTDEVYDRILYDGALHTPIAIRPGMQDRTITINSTGKTFSMTGWKIGYVIAPAHLTDAVRRTHQFITFATSTPFQEAMATAMESAASDGYYAELAARYSGLRDQMQEGLVSAGLPVLPVYGSFFLLADIRGTGFDDDVSFCKYLTTEIGVAAIPPSAFYADPSTAPKLARFCFAKEPETLAAAAQRLKALQSPVS